MNKISRLIVLGFLAGWAGLQSVSAAPSISGVTGDIIDEDTIVISGANNGAKSPARPHLWADFEQGSINPTSTGTVTSWNEVQGYAYDADEGFGSSGGAKASGDTTSPVAYTLRADYASGYTANGQRSYIYRRTKLSFDITDTSQNSKRWRLWSDDYPNIYGLTQNGLHNVEDGSNTGFWGTGLTSYWAPNTWFTEEIFLKASSAVDVKDGTLEVRTNGDVTNSGNVKTKFGTRTANMTRNYVVHEVFSNISLWSPSIDWGAAVAWADEVYVDITWARVMLANASFIENATKVTPQIPTAWTSGSITAIVNTTDFSNGETAWLITCDLNNACSPGFEVTVGDAGPGGGGEGDPPVHTDPGPDPDTRAQGRAVIGR